MRQSHQLPLSGPDFPDRLRRDDKSSQVAPKSLKTGILPFKTPAPFLLHVRTPETWNMKLETRNISRADKTFLINGDERRNL